MKTHKDFGSKIVIKRNGDKISYYFLYEDRSKSMEFDLEIEEAVAIAEFVKENNL